MKIIKSKDKKWLDEQGYSKKVLLNGKDFNYPGGLVQEIKIKAGETAKEHYHKKQTEIFYFLTENGYWTVNGEKMNFETGDMLIIEPLDRHMITNNTDKDYIYLAFKLNYSPEDLYWT